MKFNAIIRDYKRKRQQLEENKEKNEPSIIEFDKILRVINTISFVFIKIRFLNIIITIVKLPTSLETQVETVLHYIFYDL